MDARSRTFWEMEKESIVYALKNESVWGGQAVVAFEFKALEVNAQEMDLAFKAQDANDPGGYVAQKNKALAKFYRKIYKLGKKLTFYANRVDDDVLLADVAITETEFDHLSEKEALVRCNTLIKRGNEYLDKTADYHITAEELFALGEELTRLEQMKPEIGVITNDRKSAKRSIRELMTEAHRQLTNLDDAFEGMIDDDVDFIDGWFAVRKIKGRHQTKDNGGNKPAAE